MYNQGRSRNFIPVPAQVAGAGAVLPSYDDASSYAEYIPSLDHGAVTLADEPVEELVYYECNRFIPALRGAPVSAIACSFSRRYSENVMEEEEEEEDDDDWYKNMSKFLYVASHCTSWRTPMNSPTLRLRNSGGTSAATGSSTITSSHNKQGARGAILATHCLPSTACYSTFVSHREVEKHCLHKVTAALTSTQSSTLALTRNSRVTKTSFRSDNSYRPPFGPFFFNNNSNFSTNTVQPQQHHLPTPSDPQFQVGIRSIIPLPSYNFHVDTNQDYVVTASPSGVRMHTVGGLLVNDRPLPGMGCATITPSYDSSPTHITVGALASSITAGNTSNSAATTNSIVCLDLYGHLKPVLKVSTGPSVVTCLETNQPRNAIIAGLDDGMLKVVDGSLRDWETCMTTRHQGHAGGVANIAISPDGNTIATTGLLSFHTNLNVFPDPQILIYDLRMFGRGGLPYRFSGIGGGPRFLSFLDDSTLLAASGQPGGGMQIFPIFTDDPQQHSLFIQPQYLYNNEEQITALHVDAQNIITVGTSHSQIIQFATNAPYMHPDMESPAYPPSPSGMAFDPRTLSQSYSLGSGNIFGQHVIFDGNTSLSSVESFGKLEQQCIIPAPRRRLHHAIHEVVQTRSNDFLSTLPTKSVGLHDLLLQHTNNHKRHSTDHVIETRYPADNHVKRYNPNQLLFNEAAYKLAYDDSFAVNNKAKEQTKKHESSRDTGQEDAIPYHYRRVIRPAGSLSFDYSKFNKTLLFPGWDCHERNVYVAPVLTLLYYIPEYRKALQSVDIQRRIIKDATASAKRKPLSIFYETGELLAELSFLFQQIDMLSTHALVSQIPSPGVFSPKNFLATFTQMPEAAALNLFDTSSSSSSEAVAVLDLNKRAEAFYRFLIHHLDSALGFVSTVTEDSKDAGWEHQNTLKESSRPRLVESVQGMKVLTVNTFPKTSSTTATETRALVLPLTCDTCSPNSQAISFGELLLSSLYVECSVKAYCKISKAYENVKQQRSICSLPRLLSLSASGVKKSDGTAQWWQSSNRYGGKWLPSQVELEIIPDEKVVVRELLEGLEPGSSSEWHESQRSLCLPELYSKSIFPQRSRYALFAVISFIHSEEDSSPQSAANGHYAIHLCIPKAASTAILNEQIRILERCMLEASAFREWFDNLQHPDIRQGSNIPSNFPHLTKSSQLPPDILSQRVATAKDRLSTLAPNQWILFNGIAVTLSSVDDARDFEKTFKEPSLFFFQAAEYDDFEFPLFESHESANLVTKSNESITNDLFFNGPSVAELPNGSLIAVDSEAVLVAHAESILTDAGSRLTRADGRYALARLSLFDCHSRSIFMDDYVMPKEKVVDYLTRFSGVHPEDLDCNSSRHHLVTMRVAYLKLRALVQRGCVFVGHGLDKDLEIINMFVPPYQLIDTVNIFRKGNSRKISLRFLANYLLGRDMQQDTHDSVEDAKTTYEIYLTALRLMSQGRFNQVLDDIYEYGRKNEWRLGLDE